MPMDGNRVLASMSCEAMGAGYPCGENPINIVSLSLACSGLALVMVSVFSLFLRVLLDGGSLALPYGSLTDLSRCK